MCSGMVFLQGLYILSPSGPANYIAARACWNKGLIGSGEGYASSLNGSDLLTWDVGYTTLGPWVQTGGGENVMLLRVNSHWFRLVFLRDTI